MRNRSTIPCQPCSADYCSAQPFLVGVIVGIAVPCTVTLLVDRCLRRSEERDRVVSQRHMMYDDGSLEPELLSERG
ncbi:MAG: hypothetical protein SPI16_03805 [Porphyromonas sp.]|uniref:hypothetical protein n=1 Tax=Porphyromonas sp. TaxID=1924944 RepID=UPI002A919B8D|nr:hypothetical protein [Porphyromonas sp.]MDD7469231.1 hypothetical protein [Bacteroidales bacterium]MDY6102156.1 hypothetical protein [Porphyromonas sp.]